MTRPTLRAPTRDEALLLDRHPVFAALPPEALLELRQAAHLVVLGAGEPLWHQGQAAHSIGLVVAGRCKWIREDSGKEVIDRVSIPGDLLGAIGFALASSYSASVICLRRARILLLPSLVVRRVLQRHSLSLAALASTLATETGRLMQMVQNLSAGNVERRLASALVSLAERAGEPFPGGILIPLRLRRADLAALAATTLESASRTISAWRRRALITPEPAGYLVRDLDALRALAAGASPGKSGSR